MRLIPCVAVLGAHAWKTTGDGLPDIVVGNKKGTFDQLQQKTR